MRHYHLSRADFLSGAIGAGGLILAGWPARVFGDAQLAAAGADSGTVTLPFANGIRQLVAYPQKRRLILLTSRPVQLETPFGIFDQGAFTPNDAFFVRWHLAGTPTSIDGNAHRIQVHGLVSTPLSLSVDDLKTRFEPVEIAAVCECAGNSRGFFSPRVPGGQWGNGAMGNAKWRGARLRDILNGAGIKAGAVQVRFNGLDTPALPQTPDFIKALDVDVAMSENVIVAYAMNGDPLPLLNGYPVRLVVPGWYATYWVKMLSDIEVIDAVEDNFWMKTAYRIPADPCACAKPGEKVKTVPVSRLTVRSFITNLADGDVVRAARMQTVRGIAFDSGYGIDRVLFSSDGGRSWTPATLGVDEGRYSFRRWEARFAPAAGREYSLMSMAINAIGETQRITPVWNASGYVRNSIERVRVRAA